jgi:hypothetical protein
MIFLSPHLSPPFPPAFRLTLTLATSRVLSANLYISLLLVRFCCSPCSYSRGGSVEEEEEGEEEEEEEEVLLPQIERFPEGSLI